MLWALVLSLTATVVLGDFVHQLTNDSWCPVLARQPQPRREPWNIRYARDLANWVSQADRGQGLELVLYGDSITEGWRGTDQGWVCARCNGDDLLFQQYFGGYRNGILAVGGDQVAHLTWRLIHGEMPETHHPKVAMIMIGTNDLSAVAACTEGNQTVITAAAEGVTQRLAAMIEILQGQLPHTELVLLGLTPRGDNFTAEGSWIWPSIFSPAIEYINTWLEKQAEATSYLTFIDCGSDLLVDGQLTPLMFADGVHPTYIGMDRLGSCLAKSLDSIFEGTQVLRPVSQKINETAKPPKRKSSRHFRVSSITQLVQGS